MDLVEITYRKPVKKVEGYRYVEYSYSPTPCAPMPNSSQVSKTRPLRSFLYYKETNVKPAPRWIDTSDQYLYVPYVPVGGTSHKESPRLKDDKCRPLRSYAHLVTRIASRYK